MVPLVTFKTSYYLQNRILSCHYDREKLNSFRTKLESHFKKNKEIIQEIAEFTGIPWKLDLLPVWVFQGWYPSISSPIMVNTYGEDIDFCMFNVIHEIIHNNIMDIQIKDGSGEWDHIELEAIVNLVTVHILKKRYSKEKLDELIWRANFGGYYKYVWIRVEELQKELKNISFKSWLGETYE